MRQDGVFSVQTIVTRSSAPAMSCLSSHFLLRPENVTVGSICGVWWKGHQALLVARGGTFPGSYQHQSGSPVSLLCPLLVSEGFATWESNPKR